MASDGKLGVVCRITMSARKKGPRHGTGGCGAPVFLPRANSIDQDAPQQGLSGSIEHWGFGNHPLFFVSSYFILVLRPEAFFVRPWGPGGALSK